MITHKSYGVVVTEVNGGVPALPHRARAQVAALGAVLMKPTHVDLHFKLEGYYGVQTMRWQIHTTMGPFTPDYKGPGDTIDEALDFLRWQLRGTGVKSLHVHEAVIHFEGGSSESYTAMPTT